MANDRPEMRVMVVYGIHGMGKTVALKHMMRSTDGKRNITVTSHFVDMSLCSSLADRLVMLFQKRIRQPTLVQAFLHWAWRETSNACRELGRWLAIITTKRLPTAPDVEGEFTRLGQELRSSRRQMAIFIDDLHLASKDDLRTLATLVEMSDKDIVPIHFIVAGLNVVRRRLRDVEMYDKGLVDESELNFLNHVETDEFLTRTSESHGRRFSPEAKDEIYRLSKGFPSLLQHLGHRIWRDADAKVMTLDDVNRALPVVTRLFGNSHYKQQLDLMAPAELRFVLAMASLPAAERTLARLAKVLGGTEADHAPTLAKLQEDDIIEPPDASQLLDFHAPLFDEYLLSRTGQAYRPTDSPAGSAG